MLRKYKCQSCGRESYDNSCWYCGGHSNMLDVTSLDDHTNENKINMQKFELETVEIKAQGIGIATYRMIFSVYDESNKCFIQIECIPKTIKIDKSKKQVIEGVITEIIELNMKTENQIRDEMVKLRKELITAQREHNNLNQIDMLSDKGSKLKAKQNYLLGQLGFATWIINK